MGTGKPTSTRDATEPQRMKPRGLQSSSQQPPRASVSAFFTFGRWPGVKKFCEATAGCPSTNSPAIPSEKGEVPCSPGRPDVLPEDGVGVSRPSLPVTRGAEGLILQGGEGPRRAPDCLCPAPGECWMLAGGGRESGGDIPGGSQHRPIEFVACLSLPVEGKGPKAEARPCGHPSESRRRGGKGSFPSPRTSTAGSGPPPPAAA